MHWPPDTADDLPAPRDDEPPSLRQDIADELADHLQQSFTRELHSTPEEAAAKQNVLDRFGDARRVACQLWFDAMKEKIVSQRLNLVLSSLMTVVCLGALGLMAMMLRESRQASQAMLEQSQAVNAALLEKLAVLASPPAAPPAAEPAKSMEWNSVKIRLVKDKAGGEPAEGYEVKLHGHLLDTAKEMDIVRKTGADGIADLGLVRPGQHTLTIVTSWNERRSDSKMTVLPGQPIVEEVVCPGAPREEAIVSFSVEMPSDLCDMDLWTVLHQTQQNREVGGASWRWGNDSVDPCVIVGPADRVRAPRIENRGWATDDFRFSSEERTTHGLEMDYDALNERYESQAGRRGRARGAVAVPTEPPEAKKQFRPYRFLYPNAKMQGEVRLPVGQYRLRDILACEHPISGEATDVIKVHVVSGVLESGLENLQNFRSIESRRRAASGAEWSGPIVPFASWLETSGKPPKGRGATAHWPSEFEPVFEIKPGETNKIVIALPPLLIENVRKFLEETK